MDTETCTEILGHPCRGCQRKAARQEFRQDTKWLAMLVGFTFSSVVAAGVCCYRVARSGLKVVATWLGL